MGRGVNLWMGNPSESLFSLLFHVHLKKVLEYISREVLDYGSKPLSVYKGLPSKCSVVEVKIMASECILKVVLTWIQSNNSLRQPQQLSFRMKLNINVIWIQKQ